MMTVPHYYFWFMVFGALATGIVIGLIMHARSSRRDVDDLDQAIDLVFDTVKELKDSGHFYRALPGSLCRRLGEFCGKWSEGA